MRKPDRTIVFGNHNEAVPPPSQAPTLRGNDPSFPVPVTYSNGRATASPTTGSMRAPASLRSPTSREYEKVWFGNGPVSSGPVSGAPLSSSPLAVSHHRLADDLVEERPTYLRGAERGLAFAAISLALLGVAAAGTYFFFGTRNTVVEQPALVGHTTLTNADVPANPAPTPAATPADQPWDKPEVDAVRAPGLANPQAAPTVPKDVSPTSPQLLPTERPQATSAPTVEATKIQGKQPAAAPVPRAKAKTPPPGMSDEALERAGYYRNLNPTPGQTTLTPGPTDLKAPSAASTEEPSQFTPKTEAKPEPSNVMPDVTIKQ